MGVFFVLILAFSRSVFCSFFCYCNLFCSVVAPFKRLSFSVFFELAFVLDQAQSLVSSFPLLPFPVFLFSLLVPLRKLPNFFPLHLNPYCFSIHSNPRLFFVFMFYSTSNTGTRPNLFIHVEIFHSLFTSLSGKKISYGSELLQNVYYYFGTIHVCTCNPHLRVD